MKLVIATPDAQWEEIIRGNEDIEWIRVEGTSHFSEHPDANGYFNFLDTSIAANYNDLKAPVFINSVLLTLSEGKFPANVIRINGWPGFVTRSVWEIAGNMDKKSIAILQQLKKEIVKVADEPGFISGRIISMIINEAYYALSEGVSTKEDIDIAMKLGTNYPFGPFEWGQKIGISNVGELLKKLSKNDDRYIPSDLLLNESILIHEPGTEY